MAVELDLGPHLAAYQPHQLVHAPWRGHADGVGQAQAVHAGLVQRAADAQQVGLRRAERILAAEAHLATGRAHQRDAGRRGGDDGLHVPAMRIGAQQRRRPEVEVDAVHARVQGAADVRRDAAHVGQQARAQAQAGQHARVIERAGRGCRRGDLDVGDAEVVERQGNSLLIGRCKVRPGELLALAQGRLDDQHALAHPLWPSCPGHPATYRLWPKVPIHKSSPTKNPSSTKGRGVSSWYHPNAPLSRDSSLDGYGMLSAQNVIRYPGPW